MMTSRNTAPALYHGTTCALRVGQALTADAARQANPDYPAHIAHVWVTSKPLVAATHAVKHGRQFWDTGHVYQVAPINPADVELDPLGNGASFRSVAGFRVVAELGTPAQVWDTKHTNREGA